MILTANNLSRAGLRHGFTTRIGGFSTGPYASFNLSLKVGDDPQSVARNRARFDSVTGLAFVSLVGLSQVHGAGVLEVDRPIVDLPPEAERCFDVSITDRQDVVLGVRTADCIPILVCCDRPRAIAAVHAGWRGTLQGVAREGVKALISLLGCDPARMLAAIGPGIHRCCYQVGAEVFDPFLEHFGSTIAVRHQDGSLHVDLVEANRRQLLDAGIPLQAIEVLNLCTSCREDLFFSHRRDRGICGRHQAFITVVAGP